MESNRAGKVELAILASLLAAVAALASVATAGLVAWQVREEGRLARDSARLESLWHVSEQWNSPAMLDIRSAAAAGLLARRPTADVGSVLDFFDEIVLLVHREALDEDLTALHFYWPLANYWAASGDYVREVQGLEPSAWKDVADLVQRLAVLEARRKRRPVNEILPSADQVQQFLADEHGQDECTDDSDAEKTPA